LQNWKHPEPGRFLLPGIWTDPTFALKALRYENMPQLGMEGHRFFDLVRWSIAEPEINNYLEKDKITYANLNDTKFDSAKDNYFPIS
jgi:starch-binding outer membrane protein, SusD/RagB family